MPGSRLALVGFVGLCLLVAVSDAAITQTSVHDWYAALRKPPGTPPDWLFGPVWTALYVLMGVGAWRVWRRIGEARSLRLWGWQLLVNALWTPAFFGLRSVAAGLPVIVLLTVLVGLTLRAFARIDRAAALMFVPYLAWVGYAAYLNAGLLALNRG